jgi:hypothetical protein
MLLAAAAETPILQSALQVMVDWIRVRKESGAAWPWTQDPLLRDFRWCNVKRADDRVSRELLQCWYRNDADARTLLVAATLGRLVNRTEALMEVSAGAYFEIDHLAGAAGVLSARASRGHKVFTAAYIVPGVPGLRKVDSVCGVARTVADNSDAILASSMRATWENLTQINGLGSFLAGQIVADLALLPIGARWPDASTWAPVGPGSARGWNRLTGQPLNRHVTQAEFDVALPHLVSTLTRVVPEIWVSRGMIAFDAQSACCEIDKFLRLTLGQGSVRARYAPPASRSLF